jgi:hypothetical protein
MTETAQAIGPRAAVPAWLKWLVGTLGVAIATGAPTAGKLYLDARKQTQEAEAGRETMRMEVLLKASRAGNLREELRDCQANIKALIASRPN